MGGGVVQDLPLTRATKGDDDDAKTRAAAPESRPEVVEEVVGLIAYT